MRYIPGTGRVWFLYRDLINACLVDPVNGSISQLTHQLCRERKRNKTRKRVGVGKCVKVAIIMLPLHKTDMKL